MDTAIIKKSKVEGIIESLMKMGRVIGPTQQGDYMAFSPISASQALNLDYTNSKLSPKGCFFPQTEVLFYYEKDSQQIKDVPLENTLSFLIGIRPCDARAIKLLDLIFDDEQYKDVYYLTRRKNTVIIGLACDSPQNSCFCAATGGSPVDTTGMDMLWQDLGDRYFIKAVTDQGKELLSKFPDIQKAEEEDGERSQKQEQDAISGMQPSFEQEKVFEKLSSSFEDKSWQTIHEKCLGCGACAFVCPTCHCFDIQDENCQEDGKRVRLWDSCMFPLFTLHTSGHNPRTSGKERMRQRIMHKFYYYKVNNGQIACVGCGRCIRECPVNMDIRQIVSAYS